MRKIRGAFRHVLTAFVWAIRHGVLRGVSQLIVFLSAALSYSMGEYGAATVSMLLLIWLEISDPRRPSRVIMVRRKS